MPVSVVIPAFDEQGNIGRLIEETLRVTPPGLVGEIVVVDDCSSDGTVNETREAARQYGKVRLVRHLRNAGQSACLRSGISRAACPVIATMDGDGQNDPADIAALYDLLAPPGDLSGFALVGGIRARRMDSGAKKFASRAANGIRDFVLRDGCPDTGCGLKLFWREAFMSLPYFTSMHRYLPAFFQTYGYKTTFVPVNDRPRLAGRSKYNNVNRALIGLYDLVGVSWLRRRTLIPPIAEE